MSKTIWDKFAPIYSLTMKSQKNIYNYMYSHIGEVVTGKTVLELATGPGMIAKNVAWSAKKIIATDFSPDMIAQAKKSMVPCLFMDGWATLYRLVVSFHSNGCGSCH